LAYYQLLVSFLLITTKKGGEEILILIFFCVFIPLVIPEITEKGKSPPSHWDGGGGVDIGKKPKGKSEKDETGHGM
jgi:hypothetical protein